MKIDIFPHILPRKFFEKMLKLAPGAQKWTCEVPVLVDVELRLRIMDRYEGYAQVLTQSSPPLDWLAGPADTPDLARLMNDGLADIVDKYPDRFLSFVASLPMNNPDAALKEIDRAVNELHATGVILFTSVAGRALDAPEFQPIFDRMAQLRLPIWLHPIPRPASVPDYPTEKRSKYDSWWAFGWPYETSVAMSRLVFSGIFDRLPELQIITHHMGAMIPYFAGRVGFGLDQLGNRSDDPDDAGALKRLRKRPLEYFKMFYGDTALFGDHHAMECGLAFFGADRVLFGTDMPWDPEKGPGFIRETIAAMGRMRASEEDKAKIYEGNARRMLRLRR